jgi:hypothetical protein
LSDSSDDKPKVSLDTADLKARLGLKRRVKASTDSGVEPAVAEARRKAEAEHSQAGVAEEEFTFMGQDNTPPPQPLPEKEVQGYIDFEGRKKSMLVPLVIGLVALAGVAFVLGNIFGTASQENEIRDGFIQEARDKYQAFAAVKPKDGDKTKLERWMAMSERLNQLNDVLQKMTSGYGISSVHDQIETLAQDEAKQDRVALLTKEFLGLQEELKAMKRDKIFFSASSLLGKSVQNPVLMVKVAEFATQTEVFQADLDEQLRRLRKVGKKYASARVELFRRNLAGEFANKRLLAKPENEPVILPSWTLSVPDVKATATCSGDKGNLRDPKACGACCKTQLGAKLFDVGFDVRKECVCEVESAKREACRNANPENKITALPCPSGYTCVEGDDGKGKCGAQVPGTLGRFVALYEKQHPRKRGAKWYRSVVNENNEVRDRINNSVARVDWAGVTTSAQRAYAIEVQRDRYQLALNALSSLATKAKTARWLGKNGLRETLNEWACKAGTANVGEPDAFFDCDGVEAKSLEEGMKQKRSESKAAFEKLVREAAQAKEAPPKAKAEKAEPAKKDAK